MSSRKNSRAEVELHYKRFGELVRAMRESKNLSQTDIASRLGVSRVSLANIESGRQRIMLREAIELGNILGVALADLQSEFNRNRLDKKVEEQSKKVRDALSSIRDQFRKGGNLK